jgi:hypothetical protein
MQPVPPAVQELAHRLRSLRELTWPGKHLTQAALAKAFSAEAQVAPATLSTWESLTAPKLPSADRINAYARYFATSRSIEEGLLPLDSLTEPEQAAYRELAAELTRLHRAARKPSAGDVIAVRKSWHFADPGPVTLICARLPEEEMGPLANPRNLNYTELQAYADLDALMELRGHIRAENPTMDVFFKAAPDINPDDLTGHVVVLGGIAWNDITKRLSEMTAPPVRQVADPPIDAGEIFVATTDGKDQPFYPKREESGALVEDVGLLMRVPNPLNSNRTLTICNGIHSRGVLGAVRTLTDKRIRESNEGYIATRFKDSRSFAILIRVQVIQGKAMTPDFNIPNTVLYQWSQDVVANTS